MTPNPGGDKTFAAVVVAVDAVETTSSSSSSSLGSGATTEETYKWDGGGRGEKRRQHYDEDDEIRSKESGGQILSSGAEDREVGGTPSCLSSGNGYKGRCKGGSALSRRSHRRWPSVIVDDEIDGSSAGREWGDETPSLSLAVVHVIPIRSHAGGRRRPSAGFRRMQGCGCARTGGHAGPGTSAARQGGRRRGPPPNDTAAAAAGIGAL